jgi:hypothetical protein
MKLTYFTLISLLLFGFSACQETKDLVLEAPMSKITGISDTWKLSKVVQADLLTNIPERSELDLSNLYIGTEPMSISFTADGNYTLTPGTTLNYIGGSGTWSFNNNDYPTQINLVSNGVNTTLQLFAPTREVDNTLEVGAIQYCSVPDNNGVLQATPAVGYMYIFDRQ